jgi:Holliday junction resolvasome RuvABC endonuclease subunit
MKDLKGRPESFCAIDASTNSLAFAYFKNENLMQYGKIKYFGNDIYEKISDTAHKTQGFFKQFPGLNHIVIEQPIYLNSPKTAANLSMSHGALVGSAALAGVRNMASVSPMQWQNWIGNGRLTTEEKASIRKEIPGKSESWYKSKDREFRKNRTIKFVNNKFYLKIVDDDVADAIAIGSWAIDNWVKVF